MKIIKDTNAVSPVVASLMLIMVVAGSVTFLAGMMQNMNSQADQVAGKSTSADRTSMKINIISSDLAMPAVEPLVKAYNDKHMGVMLQLQESATLNMTSNVASAILILVSLAHTFGGLSWYFNSETYSNTILAISAVTIMMAIFPSGWTILQKRNVS